MLSEQKAVLGAAESSGHERFDDRALLKDIKTLMDNIKEKRKAQRDLDLFLGVEQSQLFDGMKMDNSPESRERLERYRVMRKRELDITQELQQLYAELKDVYAQAQMRMVKISGALEHKGVIALEKVGLAQEIVGEYQAVFDELRKLGIQR